MESRTKVFTIGCWRVALENYLRELSGLGVRTVVDIRGNPTSGREKDLFKESLKKGLKRYGIGYVYAGDRVGEDPVLDGKVTSLVVKGLLASCNSPVCLFGHMHEPEKCHRMQLIDLLADSPFDFVHIVWETAHKAKYIDHAAVKEIFETRTGFFQQQHQELLAMQATRPKPKLTVVEWSEFDEELLWDGNDYCFRLPFDTEVLWFPTWMSLEEAHQLKATVQSRVRFFHAALEFQQATGGARVITTRRGMRNVSDHFDRKSQGYRKDGGTLMRSQRFEEWTSTLRDRVETATGCVFNAIWFNNYLDGTSSIQWHTDSDFGLGPDPHIGSLSLGATREFSFKSKRPLPDTKKIAHIKFPLFPGSLLVMGKNSQVNWLHAVPTMEGVTEERLNLTFRMYAQQAVTMEEDALKSRDGPDAQVAECVAGRQVVRVELGSWKLELETLVGVTFGEFRECLPVSGADVTMEVDGRVPLETAVVEPNTVVNVYPKTAGARVVPFLPATHPGDGLELRDREIPVYSPPPMGPPPGAEPLIELLHSLGGVTAAAKGKGAFGRLVFHQTCDFVAVYSWQSKASVHLWIVPKRLVRSLHDLDQRYVPLLRRLQLYAAWLRAGLRSTMRSLTFRTGVRLRTNISPWYVEFCSQDISARSFTHVEEYNSFTSTSFIPLDQVVQAVSAGTVADLQERMGDPSALPVCLKCKELWNSLPELRAHSSACRADLPKCVGFEIADEAPHGGAAAQASQGSRGPDDGERPSFCPPGRSKPARQSTSASAASGKAPGKAPRKKAAPRPQTLKEAGGPAKPPAIAPQSAVRASRPAPAPTAEPSASWQPSVCRQGASELRVECRSCSALWRWSELEAADGLCPSCAQRGSAPPADVADAGPLEVECLRCHRLLPWHALEDGDGYCIQCVARA
mmetsp:Transcript_31453/g.81735  ORF Transcript_31453/g.81735 Transcript_31453/m.81735 type:complete len:912 (+) Transcript_31453:19-2754(+)